MSSLNPDNLYIPIWLLYIPLIIQGLLILVDEFYFHQKRGLPKWEQINHPLDSLFMLCILLYCLNIQFAKYSFWIFLGLSVSSAFLVTRDEFVHSKKCTPGEQWNHGLLFISHCLSLVSIGFLWSYDVSSPLIVFSFVVFAFMTYQVIYWPLLNKRQQKD